VTDPGDDDPIMDRDTSPHNSESTSVFLPFVQQVRENRNRHIKGSLEEKFWKDSRDFFCESGG
ncbi:hypothetical protein, partial [Escherichia coli]|uniref:hypothetical protein n=1 Tax=Escherichia coli TaxID=562 RepID=UPI00293BDA07